MTSPATRDRRRTKLPYGLWRCADGREVLFNRSYKPIWQRLAGVVSAADLTEWVAWSDQRWFYNDGDTTTHAALCRRLETVLAAFQDGRNVDAWLRVER